MGFSDLGTNSIFIHYASFLFYRLIMQRLLKSILVAVALSYVLGRSRKMAAARDANSLQAALQKAKHSLESVLSLIYRRYELDKRQGMNLFAVSSNADAKAWDIIKWRMASKIVHPENELPSYHMVFGGSSVTAGHDNFYNQSYPYVFKKRLQSTFDKLGIDLIVRNIALGANNCVPYIQCYESMGGPNIDFAGWEQSYNCGHDEPVFENALRNAAWNSPSVVYYSASGAFAPTKCPESSDPIPYSAEEWTPRSAGLSEWNVTLDAVVQQREILFKYNAAGASSARFSNSFRNDYAGVGTLGFNVWEKNRMCTFEKKGNMESGCNAFDSVEECGLKFLTKEASLYGQESGKGANWHPPRAIHMLRGEVIVWLYSLILYETVEMIATDLQSKDVPTLITDYADKVKALKQDMPNPKKCGNLHCAARPRCFTDFRPHYGHGTTLKDVVVGAVKWEYDSAEDSDWSKHFGYLDAKPTYRSKGKEELHLQITINEANNFLWLCGLSKESLAHAVFYLDQDVEVSPTDKASYVPSAKRVVWEKKRYAGFECKEVQELPTGKHVLSIANGGEKTLEITHIIMF